MTSQRMAHGVQFTECPECGQSIGVRGLASHRAAAHGVVPVASKAKPAKPSKAEREAAHVARLAALVDRMQAETAAFYSTEGK